VKINKKQLTAVRKTQTHNTNSLPLRQNSAEALLPES